eukprot:RCo012301
MKFSYSPELPITSAREKILDLVRSNPVIILVGETGSGKTTQVPQYLLQDILLREARTGGDGGLGPCGRPRGARMVGVTQPRRVAATTVAQRVAWECGVQLGQEVGYAVRFDDVTGPRTRLKYMTDGILLRELLTDSLLSAYSVLVLDEAHERTLHSDV